MKSREIQLHLYRLAWSRRTGLDLDEINASFVYLGEADESARIHDVPVLSEQELVAQIEPLMDGLTRRSL